MQELFNCPSSISLSSKKPLEQTGRTTSRTLIPFYMLFPNHPTSKSQRTKYETKHGRWSIPGLSQDAKKAKRQNICLSPGIALRICPTPFLRSSSVLTSGGESGQCLHRGNSASASGGLCDGSLNSPGKNTSHCFWFLSSLAYCRLLGDIRSFFS